MVVPPALSFLLFAVNLRFSGFVGRAGGAGRAGAKWSFRGSRARAGKARSRRQRNRGKLLIPLQTFWEVLEKENRRALPLILQLGSDESATLGASASFQSG